MDDLQLLHDLVAIPSPTGSTGKAVEFLVEEMRRRRFDEAYVDAAGNAVGVAGTGPVPILLVGHIDTVPGDLPVRLAGGVLHGRGAVDAKGPLAAFVAAATRFVGRRDVRIVVVGCLDEEAESHGARHLIARWQPRAVVIGEPSGTDGVTIGYKGIVKIRAVFEEDLQHTGAPFPTVADRGVGFWTALQGWLAPRHGTGLFDTPTAKLGSFNTTLLPNGRDRAELVGSVRIPPGFPVEELRAFLRDRIGSGFLEVPEVAAAWMGDKNSPVSRAFVAAVRREGLTPRYLKKTGTSDANLLVPAWGGAPCVAYGPGDAALDHTPQERIAVAEYRTAIRVLSTALDQVVQELAPPVTTA